MTHALAQNTFSYADHSLRMVEMDGQPWFVLRDVCRILELENPSMVSSRLDDDEKGVSSIYTLGGPQEMLVISESGLYAAILRSNKPEAKSFRKWITAEVLPSLRKHGRYEIAPQPQPQASAPSTDTESLREALRGMVRAEVLSVLSEVLNPAASK